VEEEASCCWEDVWVSSSWAANSVRFESPHEAGIGLVVARTLVLEVAVESVVLAGNFEQCVGFDGVPVIVN